ncbi:MAG: mannose-1-phosphate guanylyltransferase/mannose-6-phosphate isomerase [Proteobacteria bacterium]|nr:mannose-1-phosphate guanylyltransferase/mannose-6-phosphate isomerase [Pseudomonadota bacterium]
MTLVPVILSGGAGTRLWPLSRELHPKQLLPLTGENTMLQQTVERLAGLDVSAPVIVCNEAHRFLVGEQLRQIAVTPLSLLLEPFGRNTAPAIALAAHAVRAGVGDDAVLLVLPADHVIRDLAAFRAAVGAALPAAQAGNLVTFGIVPDRPETGYGYIQRGAAQQGAYRIERFVEKPDLARAQQFLAAGSYYWNSGMFMFRAARYLEELTRCAPVMAQACAAVYAGLRREGDFARIDAELFAACPSDSIDYAVMEKTTAAVVVPLDAGWSDVGSWSSLHETLEHDADGNVVRGDVLLEDTHGSYLFAQNRLLAAVGLRDHVVVETDDAVLVAPKARAQEVKAIVQKLKDAGRPERAGHRVTFHPWGMSELLRNDVLGSIARLTVRPGAALKIDGLRRRVHWLVTAGTARLTRGETVLSLAAGDMVAVAPDAPCTLANAGTSALHLVEVSCQEPEPPAESPRRLS